VLLPAGHPLVSPDVVESYRWFGECWADTLRHLGAQVRVVGIAEARGTMLPAGPLGEAVRLACFGTLSPYEVLMGSRKVVGLAQIRRTNVLLQSGIHLAFDADGLAELLAPHQPSELAAELKLRAAGLAEIGLGNVTADDLIAAFGRTLYERHGVRLEAGAWEPEELARAAPSA
jgi:lipoate---protein ligase